MKTKQCLVIVMTLLCLCVKAQNLRVTGVVRDKSDVIIGASVMVKNSTVGTVTDMDGRYLRGEKRCVSKFSRSENI